MSLRLCLTSSDSFNLSTADLTYLKLVVLASHKVVDLLRYLHSPVFLGKVAFFNIFNSLDDSYERLFWLLDVFF